MPGHNCFFSAAGVNYIHLRAGMLKRLKLITQETLHVNENFHFMPTPFFDTFLIPDLPTDIVSPFGGVDDCFSQEALLPATLAQRLGRRGAVQSKSAARRPSPARLRNCKKHSSASRFLQFFQGKL